MKEAYFKEIFKYPQQHLTIVYYDRTDENAIIDLHLKNDLAIVYNLKADRPKVKKGWYPRCKRHAKSYDMLLEWAQLNSMPVSIRKSFNAKTTSELMFKDEKGNDWFFYYINLEFEKHVLTAESRLNYHSVSNGKGGFIIFVDKIAEENLTCLERALIESAFKISHDVLMKKSVAKNTFRLEKRAINGDTTQSFNKGLSSFQCFENFRARKKVCNFRHWITYYKGHQREMILGQHTCQ